MIPERIYNYLKGKNGNIQVPDKFFNLSTPTLNWIQKSNNQFPVRTNHSALVYNNKMWIIGGYDGGSLWPYTIYKDVWNSTDGINWTQVTNDGVQITSHRSFVYDGKMWISGGYIINTETQEKVYNNKLYYSTDGITWNISNFGVSVEDNSMLTFNNNIYTMGGSTTVFPYPAIYNGYVKYTSDPYNQLFTYLTPTPGYGSKKYQHTSLVFNNTMWVIGGYSNNNEADVWKSTDGTIWTRTTNTGAFGLRAGHSSVSYQNSMWIIAGYKNGTRTNDIYSSTDGITWTQQGTTSPFSIRYGHASIVYNDKIWVIGGFNTSNNAGLADVWAS